MEYIRTLIKNRIVKNASWIMVGKIIRLILSFFISIISARYLGPSNYGLIGYAAAYTTFFYAFCTLGFPGPVLKKIIDEPNKEGEIVGSALIFRLASSFISVGIIAMITSVLDKNDTLAMCVVILYSISVIFMAFDTFNQWFQARLLSKYYAISTLVAYIVSSVFKIYLLITEKSVLWFAITNSVEFIVAGICIYIFYKKNNGPKLKFSFKSGLELLSISKSYILSGIMVSVYAATDKLMLKQFMTDSVVGYYSLAVSISTMWTFVLSAIIESMNPSIMELHKTNEAGYIRQNKLLYAIVFYLSLFVSVIIFVVSKPFIKILYGSEFLPAAGPLKIVVWYVAFSYLGVARDAWMMCENKQKYLVYIYLGSAVINVVLNFFLIPVFGAAGAATASLITQISTVLVIPLFIKDLIPNVKLMFESFLLKGIKENG